MRHSVKRKIKFVIMICVVFLFAGCSQAETTGGMNSDTLTEGVGESGQENETVASLFSCEFAEGYMRMIEPYASSVAYSGNVLQTEVDGHIYQFASAIAEEDCLSFVQAQETLCAFLETQGIVTKGMTYCVLSDYTNWTDSDEMTAYFGLDTLESWEQVLTTIQVSLGDYTNYGYLYALANDVAGELGWETDTEVLTEGAASTGAMAVIDTTGADDSEENITAELFREDPYLLNLVYPCFDLVYEDEETIQACKVLALQILDRLTDPYAGEEAFTDEIEVWAQEQEIEFTPTYLQFAYYSESCPLKIATRHVEVFRTESYTADSDYEAGYINEDYFSRACTVIAAIEALDEQLTTICGVFDMYPDGRIEVQLMDYISKVGQESNLGGIFYHTPNYICATTINVLPHEYIHYLYYLSCRCSDPAYESWYNEVVAYYYGSALVSYKSLLLYNENIDSTYLSRIEDRLGKKYDEPSDYIRLVRINARMEENFQYLFYLNSEASGGVKIAFGEYFVRTYGEEAFLNSMMYPSRVEEYTGKTMDEIMSDWEVDMADPEMDILVSYPDWFSY